MQLLLRRGRHALLYGLIGVAAGAGVLLFSFALHLGTDLLLTALGGFRPPLPAGEGEAAGSVTFLRPWAVPLVVATGGLLAGGFVARFAPEAEGHGTDAALHGLRDPAAVRPRVAPVKVIASAFTIGTGGSAGREGPTAQISAGFATWVIGLLGVEPELGRRLLATAIGAGIGAIFRAPVGGLLLAAELPYRRGMEWRVLPGAGLACALSYLLFGLAEGFAPLFSFPPTVSLGPAAFVLLLGLGLPCALLGLLYATTYYAVADRAKRLPLPLPLRAAVGGLLVGLIALGLPEVLGTGYGWVQEALRGQLAVGLGALLALPLARIAATACSIGSGGSGGVFGPAVVIGAFTGLAYYRLLHPLLPLGPSPAPYVLAGMAALFGGISRAPVAVVALVSEMAGWPAAAVGAALATALSASVVGRTGVGIYRAQLPSPRRQGGPATPGPAAPQPPAQSGETAQPFPAAPPKRGGQ